MRAAISIYRDLVDLAHVRASYPTAGHEAELIDLEQRLKDNVGRVLLAGIGNEARSRFEHDTGVEYPVHTVGRIAIPFEKLLGWLVRA